MTKPLSPTASPATWFLAGCLLATGALASDWASFRGPGARGIKNAQNLPIDWNPETGKNIRWRIEVPGLGHSSPVVSGNRLFVTSAITAGMTPEITDSSGIDAAESGAEHEWFVLAFDTANGNLLWKTKVSAGKPRSGRHGKASRANPTPATDGKVVVAIVGSQGLFALDAGTGETMWHVDLGVLDPGLYEDPTSHWGHASLTDPS